MRDVGSKLIVSLSQDDATVRCEVDRRTLTPRKYVLLDRAGVTRFTLELSDFRGDSGIAFPFRFVATSEDGTITVALREVELNGELAEAAFIPPTRAEKLK